jgi:predicted XRE-type DNA-binding protein
MNVEHDRELEGAVIESSGNVFADLGLPASDEDMIKVKIALAIARTLEKQDLTQAEAARRMKIDQPNVSRLMRGRLDGFSVGRLFYFLSLLGRDVDINISGRHRNRPGRIRVNAAA